MDSNPPAPCTRIRLVTFTVLVGDMGLTNSANTIASMTGQLNSTDFYLPIGDLSYADDFILRSGDTYEGSWDKWQDEMEPPRRMSGASTQDCFVLSVSNFFFHSCQSRGAQAHRGQVRK